MYMKFMHYSIGSVLILRKLKKDLCSEKCKDGRATSSTEALSKSCGVSYATLKKAKCVSVVLCLTKLILIFV